MNESRNYVEEFLDDTTLDYLLGVHGDINGACPLQRHPDDECEPPLSRDVSKLVILEWFARWWGTEYDHQQFFVAKRYCFTDLHYDSYHNFYVCVSGTRRWTLAPPSTSKWLQPRRAGPYTSGSDIVPHQGQFESCPMMKDFPFINIDLHPGDVLYIPAFWWHLVESLPGSDGVTIAYNYFFSERPEVVYSDFDAAISRAEGIQRQMEGSIRGARRSRESTFAHPTTGVLHRSRNRHRKRVIPDNSAFGKRVRWTPEEEAFLVDNLPTLQGKWADMLRAGSGIFAATRRPIDLYQKARSLIKPTINSVF